MLPPEAQPFRQSLPANWVSLGKQRGTRSSTISLVYDLLGRSSGSW